jgi:hypothetical protein
MVIIERLRGRVLFHFAHFPKVNEATAAAFDRPSHLIVAGTPRYRRDGRARQWPPHRASNETCIPLLPRRIIRVQDII